MQYTTALDHVIGILKLVGIKNIELLKPNIVHLVCLRFPCRVGQAVLTDVNRRDLRILVAAGIDDLVARSASSNQNLWAGVCR